MRCLALAIDVSNNAVTGINLVSVTVDVGGALILIINYYSGECNIYIYIYIYIYILRLCY